MNDEPVLATIPRRLIAYVLDIALAFAGIVALQALLFPINPLVRTADVASGALHAWVTLTVTVPLVVYLGACWATASGATGGMRLLRIRVRATDGGRVPKGRALIRALVLLIPFEASHIALFYPVPIWADASGIRIGMPGVYALLLVYLTVTMRTSARQGPHDLAAGTIVEQTQDTSAMLTRPTGV